MEEYGWDEVKKNKLRMVLTDNMLVRYGLFEYVLVFSLNKCTFASC